MGAESHNAAEIAARADREKTLVAASSLAAAVLLTGTKLGVGLWTNSLGILSEAAHSALDLAAAGMTLWAVRAAARPADRRHAYGHGKFENLSALFETLLLLATCVWIFSEAIQRLASGGAHVQANVWAFATVLLSIGVDLSRSRALARAARRHKSQALEADALHFSTDVWSSAVVLLGLFAVVAAPGLGAPWLESALASAGTRWRFDHVFLDTEGNPVGYAQVSLTPPATVRAMFLFQHISALLLF
ncbi:MAG TPA: cation diffusion facilitator family transporter, partial [Acidobacteriota bacterium]|nr:cation diffusion facilitator family transporter [Acidobacteriota bacterium]